MHDSWYVLLPPLIVLFLSWTTRRVVFSLVSGIVLAACIASDFSFVKTIKLVGLRFVEKTNIIDIWYQSGFYDEIYILGFLLMLGIIIRLMTHSGGMKALAKLLRQRIHTARSAEMASLALSCCFFVDDYLNSVLVGNIMRPVTDSLHIPRIKLAFLLDSMSASLAVLLPITSWAAFILIQLQVNGVSLQPSDDPIILTTPLMLYLRSVPFILYPLAIIVTAIIIVYGRFSFGMMKEQEDIAQTTGNLFGGKEPLHSYSLTNADGAADHDSGSLIDFMIPIGSLLGSLMVAMFVLNGIFQALFLAGLIAAVISLSSAMIREQLSLRSMITVIYDGYVLMKSSIILLILAWTFSRLLSYDLHTGTYLAHFLIKLVPLWVLPCIVFVTATLIASTTGSSWGTIAVTIPIALPLLTSTLPYAVTPDALPLLAPLIGAVLAGSVAGAKGCPCNVSRPTIINFPPSSIGKGKRLKRATLILINAREVKNTSRPE